MRMIKTISFYQKISIVTIVFLTLASSCKVEPPELKEIKKSKDMIIVTIEGIIYPYKEEKLITPIGARVKKIYKHQGDYVKAGDTILELDTSELEKEYEKALINYKIAEIKLRQIPPYRERASVALNNAKKELFKTYSLYREGYISLYELKIAENKYEKILNDEKKRKYEYHKEIIEQEKREKIALENLQKAKVELKKIEEMLKNKYIKSTIDGFLSELSISEGQIVFRNDVIGKVINIDRVKLKGAFFPGTYPFLHKGMVGEVKCFTVPAYIGYGKIEKLIPLIDPKTGRMTLYMSLENKNYLLQPETKCLISFKFRPGDVKAMGLEIPPEGNEIYIKSNIKSKEIK